MLAAAVIALAAAAPAAANERCRAPAEPGSWRSCLDTVHVELPQTDRVLLDRLTARLVIRDADCPPERRRRKVTIRTRGGDRLGARRATGRCRNGVTRYTAVLRPGTELRAGTIVTADWAGIDERGRPASVRLG